METEAYTSFLATLIINNNNRSELSCHHDDKDEDVSSSSSLRILDLCTGTGCIPLLLHSCLADHLKNLSVVGVDISPQAVKLADQNLRWNIQKGNLRARAQKEVRFMQADVFADHPIWTSEGDRIDRLSSIDDHHEPLGCDILISNPPYISPKSFNTDTTRSVRNWEPRLALVPRSINSNQELPSLNHEDVPPGDGFYPRLLSIAEKIKAKIVLLETADLDQAIRVASLAIQSSLWDRIEIWRDWPDQGNGVVGEPSETVQLRGMTVPIRGEGNGRAVLCWNGEGGKWIGRV